MSQARARWGEHETATMWSTPALRLVLAGVADPTRRSSSQTLAASSSCGARRSARIPQRHTRSSAPVEPTPEEIATPTPRSASESSNPPTSARCPPAVHSRYHKAGSLSGSSCSPVRPGSLTATGPRSASQGASGCLSHRDGTRVVSSLTLAGLLDACVLVGPGWRSTPHHAVRAALARWSVGGRWSPALRLGTPARAVPARAPGRYCRRHARWG
jgi:hypothetical protein